jgi:hypothetical protein
MPLHDVYVQGRHLLPQLRLAPLHRYITPLHNTALYYLGVITGCLRTGVATFRNSSTWRPCTRIYPLHNNNVNLRAAHVPSYTPYPTECMCILQSGAVRLSVVCYTKDHQNSCTKKTTKTRFTLSPSRGGAAAQARVHTKISKDCET